jgi:hypothetical protein
MIKYRVKLRPFQFAKNLTQTPRKHYTNNRNCDNLDINCKYIYSIIYFYYNFLIYNTVLKRFNY